MEPHPRSLVEEAFLLLQDGPQPAGRVAAGVLGLSGHAGAASRAVQALLGADPRFEVLDGVWSVAPGSRPVGRPLRDLTYAVVDVETTGGPFSQGHRIVEVAVVEIAEGRIRDSFRSLVNPGRSIPASMFRLNGITNESVQGAPYFDEIAEQVQARLEGRVFVAHNVGFDWHILQSQLGETVGRANVERRLCTVRLAKRLVPDLRSRTLDALADHFEIPIFERHRALGDAMATARLLIRLVDLAEQQGLADFIALDTWLAEPSGAARDRPTPRRLRR